MHVPIIKQFSFQKQEKHISLVVPQAHLPTRYFVLLFCFTVAMPLIYRCAWQSLRDYVFCPEPKLTNTLEVMLSKYLK